MCASAFGRTTSEPDVVDVVIEPVIDFTGFTLESYTLSNLVFDGLTFEKATIKRCWVDGIRAFTCTTAAD